MLIKPDPKIFQALSTLATNSSYYDVRLAEQVSSSGRLHKRWKPDIHIPQSLINQYFQGQWLGLPGSFNLLYRFRDRPYYWDRLRPTASIIHFAGLEKPWHDCEQDPNLCAGLHPDVRHWRELFRQVYHASHFEIGDFTGEEERIHYTIAKLLDGRLDS
jgi:lipopolysaccharide biosynthesis glycosyltransferase